MCFLRWTFAVSGKSCTFAIGKDGIRRLWRGYEERVGTDTEMKGLVYD